MELADKIHMAKKKIKKIKKQVYLKWEQGNVCQRGFTSWLFGFLSIDDDLSSPYTPFHINVLHVPMSNYRWSSLILTLSLKCSISKVKLCITLEFVYIEKVFDLTSNQLNAN